MDVLTCDQRKRQSIHIATNDLQVPASLLIQNDLSVFDALRTQDAQSVNEALSSVPEPSFGFIGAPPIVACRPVPLPGEMGEIDACNVVDTVRELMGFLWALAAAWISLGWIRQAVNGG